MSVHNPNRLGDECYRTVCTEVATAGPHRDLGTYYCQGCATVINRANPIANGPLIPATSGRCKSSSEVAGRGTNCIHQMTLRR